MPPMLTDVAPVKFVPRMVIVVPLTPMSGVNDVMVGGGVGGIKVKLLELNTVPPGVMTRMVPVAPPATTAVMVLSLTTVYEAALAEPNRTDAAPDVPRKPVPVIVTKVMLPPLVGVNPVMVGKGMTVTGAVTVPPCVYTVSIPDAAPTGTRTRIWVALMLTKVNGKLFSSTAVAEPRLAPVMVSIESCCETGFGTTLTIVGGVIGAAANLNVLREPTPPGVVTLNAPVAPVPTVATMRVGVTLMILPSIVPNFTMYAPVKLRPLMVIVAPVVPKESKKLSTIGGGTKVKVFREPLPFGFVTTTLPDKPWLEANIAVICVSEFTT
jgi:hypothetical protein